MGISPALTAVQTSVSTISSISARSGRRQGGAGGGYPPQREKPKKQRDWWTRLKRFLYIEVD